MKIVRYQKHKMIVMIKNVNNNCFTKDREMAETILKAEENIYNRCYKRHDRNLVLLSPLPISFEKRHRFITNFININDLKDGLKTFEKINGMLFHHAILFEPTVDELRLLNKETNVAIIFTVSHFCVPKDKVQEFGRKMINEYNLKYCIIRYANEPFKMYSVCKDEAKIKYFVVNDAKQLSFLINNDWFGKKMEIKYSSISLPGADEKYKAIFDKFEPYFLHIKPFKDAEIGFLTGPDLIVSLRSNIHKYSIFKNILAKDVQLNDYIVCSKPLSKEYISSNVFDIASVISSYRPNFSSNIYANQIYFVFVPAEVNYAACPNVLKYFHSNRINFDTFSKEEFQTFEKKDYSIFYHENTGYYIISPKIDKIEQGLKDLSISFYSNYEPIDNQIIAKSVEEMTTFKGSKKKTDDKMFKELPFSFSKEFIRNIKNSLIDEEILFYGKNSFLLSELFRFERYRGRLTIYNDQDAMTELKCHKSNDRLLLSLGRGKYDKVVLFNYFDYLGLSELQFNEFIDLLWRSLRPEGELIFNCFHFPMVGGSYIKYAFPKYSGYLERSQIKAKAMLRINYKNAYYVSEHTFISEDMINNLRDRFDIEKVMYGGIIAIFKLKKKGNVL